MPITARTKEGIRKQVMGEFARGRLHSGEGGPVVRDRKQATAIMLSMLRRRGFRPGRPRN